MDRHQQYLKQTEILEKFSNDFKHKAMTDPMAKAVFDALVAGQDPLQIIESLIDANMGQREQIMKLMERLPSQKITMKSPFHIKGLDES